jgi:hypothetical protein
LKVNALPSQRSRCAAVVFIESETETHGTEVAIPRQAAATGIKRVDYTVAIQLFHHSLENNAQDATGEL